MIAERPWQLKFAEHLVDVDDRKCRLEYRHFKRPSTHVGVVCREIHRIRQVGHDFIVLHRQFDHLGEIDQSMDTFVK